MSDQEKLNVLENMSGVRDYAILSTYLTIAGRKIIDRAYPFKSDVAEVPAKYDMLQIEIACYLLNKRGAEGQTSHNENGINRGYESASVPESMLKEITPCCGVVVGGSE